MEVGFGLGFGLGLGFGFGLVRASLDWKASMSSEAKLPSRPTTPG